MATLVVNALADRDIDHIFNALGQASGPETAADYDASFDALFVRLMQFPESGAPRGVVRP